MAEKVLLREKDKTIRSVKDANKRAVKVNSLLQQVDNLEGLQILGVQSVGNFTIVTVDLHGAVTVGVAKRNPIDPPDPQRGARLAASRALKLAFAL